MAQYLRTIEQYIRKDIRAEVDRGIFRSLLPQNLLQGGRNEEVQEQVIQLMRLVIGGIHDRLIVPILTEYLILRFDILDRLGNTIEHLHGKHTLVIVILVSSDNDNQRCSLYSLFFYV